MQGRISYLTKEYIFSQITQEEVFEKYLGISNVHQYIGTGLFCNPLRKDDNPTCSFKMYPNSAYGKGYLLYFRDWADVTGYDCIGLVQKITGKSYLDALALIAYHFNLLSDADSIKMKYVLSVDKIRELVAKSNKEVDIKIKRIPFEKHHIDYWKQFCLDIEDLEDDVFAIKCYWVNGVKYNPPKNLGFAYWFKEYNYKIYNPLAQKANNEFKFLHNNSSILQGESKLKFNKDCLIITSSYKDTKLIRKIDKLVDLNCECVATMSETTAPTKDKIEFLKTKYKNIILYYNNDYAGVKATIQQSELYGLDYIFNPSNLQKDITDVAKHNGLEKSIELIQHLLYG